MYQVILKPRIIFKLCNPVEAVRGGLAYRLIGGRTDWLKCPLDPMRCCALASAQKQLPRPFSTPFPFRKRHRIDRQMTLRWPAPASDAFVVWLRLVSTAFTSQPCQRLLITRKLTLLSHSRKPVIVLVGHKGSTLLVFRSGSYRRQTCF